MSVSTNPDRVYVNRQHRAKIRMAAHVQQRPSGTSTGDLHELGFGAILVNISPGGCCLQISNHDFPQDLVRGSFIKAIKLLHPDLDSTPIRGQVAWTQGESPNVLVGIQFLQLPPGMECSIRSYLDAFATAPL